MDPQHRLLLEVTAEALQDAGLPLAPGGGSPLCDILDRVGVFVSIASNDYVLMQLLARQGSNAFSALNSTAAAAAGRLSYTFGFGGPCESVDTACSSSLYAVRAALRSLRAGECDVAVGGAVNLLLSPVPYISFSKAGVMSPVERCKTFDASADGYVRAEGCAALVLTRADIHASAPHPHGRGPHPIAASLGAP